METEDVSPRFAELDRWPAGEVVRAVVEGQLHAVAAVAAVAADLARAAEAATAVLRAGAGRLVYVGAGTSGRLAVLDGVELPPTYGWPEARLRYFLAGGETAMFRSVEGAEDEAAAIGSLLEAERIGPHDVLIAVAASGRTPYAVAAAKAARARGALVVGLANNRPAPLLEAADHGLALLTGAEVVAGSTRMAAGTAQKATLNALSTAIMVGLGRTFGNLMVDVAARNAKLEGRRIAMLRRIVPVDEPAARRALEEAAGHVRTAVLVALGDPPATAAARLARHGGSLRAAIDALKGRE
ncbi:MAG: N-acetylmuramic acid 6-phosphate etherase [Pseudomonadota bacterium]